MADEEVVEEQVEEPVVEAAVEKPATAAEIAAAVAAAVRQPHAPSAADTEAEWQRVEAETGKTRAEIIRDDNNRRQANLRDNMPLYEELGLSRAEKVIGDDAELMEKVKAEVGRYGPEVRANPKAWEDAAHIVRSRAGLSAPKKKGAVKEEVEQDAPRVLGGKPKVNSGLSEGNRSGAARKAAPKKEYSEFEQKIIDETCGGDVEAYEKYQVSRKLPARQFAGVEAKNKADLVEEQLTRGKRF